MSIQVKYINYKLKPEVDIEKAIKKRKPDFCGDYKVEALNSFARDISWGTYTEDLKSIQLTIPKWEMVKELEPEVRPRHSAADVNEFSLTFKDKNFNLESEGIDHFIATIAGDVLSYSYFKEIQVGDFNFVGEVYTDFFKGPNIGIESLYNNFLNRTLEGMERPIIAYSVKPRMGLDIEKFRTICKEAAEGDIDIIEDDERLIDPVYCSFKERVNVMSELQKNVNTRFSVNITGPLDKMIDRLEYACSKGIKFVKVDVLVVGFDSLRSISNYIREKLNSKVAITCYPDAINMYRNLSRYFVLKMCRLCGADIIYTGTPQWSRMDDEYSKKEYTSNMSKLEQKLDFHYLLLKDISGFLNIKGSLPTISNGCDLSHAEIIQYVYKNEFDHYKFAFYIGGGISGFPAKIKDATKEWMDCVKFTASKLKDNYDNYNYQYEEQMIDAGIIVRDIKKEMGI